LRAIGGAAVVNRLAYFCLEKRGARVTAASRQIARKRYSYKAKRKTCCCRKAANRAARYIRHDLFVAGPFGSPV
jgi:hypothetical protein